jgi:hypothetical protein
MTAGRLATIVALCVGIGVIATSPAFAGDPQSKPKDDPNKRICKMVTPTGSRFSQRVCKTELEWQREQDFAQTRIDENRQSLRSPNGPDTRPQ